MMRWKFSLIAVVVVACGARTSLRVDLAEPPPDSSMDVATLFDAVEEASLDVAGEASFDATTDADVACAPRTFVLNGRPARVVLLLDRSASMGSYFPTESGVRTRFNGLLQALRGSFARYDGAFEVGALLFPNAGECQVRLPLDRITLPDTANRNRNTHSRSDSPRCTGVA
jgi:hypothetical protein